MPAAASVIKMVIMPGSNDYWTCLRDVPDSFNTHILTFRVRSDATRSTATFSKPSYPCSVPRPAQRREPTAISGFRVSDNRKCGDRNRDQNRHPRPTAALITMAKSMFAA